MFFAAALMFELPVTEIAAAWLTAPPAVVERLPPTVVAPKLVVPAVLVVVRSATVEPLTVRFVPATSVPEPDAVIAALSALVSVSEMFDPVAVTAPPKSLVPVVSVIAFAPALMLEVPVTDSAPAWLTAPPAVVERFEPTVVAPKLVVPAVLVVLRVVPVEPLTVRFVPATSVPEPDAVIAALSALMSVSEMFDPVAVTAPPKSLVPVVSVIDLESTRLY